LKPGSSKHGNARRAESASNCVIAYASAPSFSMKMPRLEFVLGFASKASVTRCGPAGSGGSNASPTNCSCPERTATRVSAISTAARETLTSSALSQSTGSGRASSTSIAISPGTVSAPGTSVSVNA
jgi:hypothetical protein